MLPLYRLLGNVLVWPLLPFVRRREHFKGTVPRRLSFDLPAAPAGREVIWVHAASVGEVRAVSGLVTELKRRRPDAWICMTVMTATGREVAEKLDAVDCVLPQFFDLDWVMGRVFSRLEPKLLLIAETELWPNELLAARRRGVPVVFANARMTARSHDRYARVRGVMRPMLDRTLVLAMADEDGRRFADLGAGEVAVLGNLKFDAVSEVDPGRRDELRAELGLGDAPVFVAGSVREGEEELVVRAVSAVRGELSGLRTIFAPRHGDQVAVVQRLADEAGITWCLRSAPDPGAELIIVDTVGELFALYGLADAAFVGGSLVSLGGQNILEPAAWGVPVIHGPHMENFTWALALLRGTTREVRDVQELGQAVVELTRASAAGEAPGEDARRRLLAARGVTERYAERICVLL